MRTFQVTNEFKNKTTEILNTKKFSAVFPYMNLVNREGFVYTEQELNQIVQFLGEFSYNEVAEFFQTLPSMVTDLSGNQQTIQTPSEQFEPETVGIL
jgi:hypothetical protein